MLDRHANAGVTHRKQQLATQAALIPQRAGRHHHIPKFGEFDGIAHQVGNDLTQAQRVPLEPGRSFGGNGKGNLQPLFFRPQGRDGRHGFKHRFQPEGCTFQRQPARLDLGKIENIVDQVQQHIGRFIDLFQIILLFGIEIGAQCQARHADDRIHGRANFVAHGGQKITLGPLCRFRRLLGRTQRRFCFTLRGHVLRNTIPDRDACTRHPQGCTAVNPDAVPVSRLQRKALVQHRPGLIRKAQRLIQAHHRISGNGLRQLERVDQDFADGKPCQQLQTGTHEGEFEMAPSIALHAKDHA